MVLWDTESHSQVIEGLLYAIGRLRGVEPTRATNAITKLHGRCKDSPDKSLREAAITNLAFLYVDQNEPEAEKTLKQAIAQPVERHEELERMVAHLRERLVHNIGDPSDTKARSIRPRATQLMQETLKYLGDGLTAWQAKHNGQQATDLTEQDKQEIKAYYTNIENIAMQVYFASGSFDEKQNKGGLEETAKARFIEEQEPLISQITATGDVSSAYHFVEMALNYQDIDPVWALKLVESSITASVTSGSANESLMATSVTTFVKQFIARHRQYLRDKANQKALMNILNAFVDVGWPEAINLTQDLEEIFR
jgi:hypothetical protein